MFNNTVLLAVDYNNSDMAQLEISITFSFKFDGTEYMTLDEISILLDILFYTISICLFHFKFAANIISYAHEAYEFLGSYGVLWAPI